MKLKNCDKLHLGAFNFGCDGWVNTDITPHIYISRIPYLARLLRSIKALSAERYEEHRKGIFKRLHYMNLCKKFPFKDDSFSYVYSAHVLEHLFKDQAAGCVSEVHRVLKQGGVFRVSVPDLDDSVNKYNSESPDCFCASIYEAENARSKNRHHWMYNKNSMESLLRKCGFSEVKSYSYRRGTCPDLEYLEHRDEGSLFMEAVKGENIS